MHLTPHVVLSSCRAVVGYVVIAAFEHPWLVRPAELAIQAAIGAAVLAHLASFFAGSRLVPTPAVLLFGCLCGPLCLPEATAWAWDLVAPHLPAALRTYLTTWRTNGLTAGELAPSERCRLLEPG